MVAQQRNRVIESNALCNLIEILVEYFSNWFRFSNYWVIFTQHYVYIGIMPWANKWFDGSPKMLIVWTTFASFGEIPLFYLFPILTHWFLRFLYRSQFSGQGYLFLILRIIFLLYIIFSHSLFILGTLFSLMVFVFKGVWQFTISFKQSANVWKHMLILSFLSKLSDSSRWYKSHME